MVYEVIKTEWLVETLGIIHNGRPWKWKMGKAKREKKTQGIIDNRNRHRTKVGRRTQDYDRGCH